MSKTEKEYLNMYEYNGPVCEFDKCIANNYHAVTIAVSEKKARSNIKFQYKKQFGKTANAKISLPGKIKLMEH